MVLVSHNVFALKLGEFEWLLSAFAMDFFFVLSGFLIARILLGYIRENKSLKVFMLNRAMRLFPVYYLTIMVLVLFWDGTQAGWWLSYTTNFEILTAIATENWSLLPGAPIGHSWSLAIEEQFYLTSTLLFALLTPQRVRATIFVGILLGLGTALVLAILEVDLLGPLLYFGTPFRFGIFGAGMLLAFYESNIANSMRRFQWIGCAAMVAGIALHLVSSALDTFYEDILANALGLPLIAWGLLLVLLCQSGRDTIVEACMSNTVLRGIGKISYGLYVFHLPVYLAFDVATPVGVSGIAQGSPTALKASLALVSVFILASISYFFLEQPIHRRRGAVAQKLFPGSVTKTQEKMS
tara:strand:- start:35225 stop:36283 length:1059 start_codon:yes stop_codon:yes gene_type:complete